MKRPRPGGVGCGATLTTRSSAASTDGAYCAPIHAYAGDRCEQIIEGLGKLVRGTLFRRPAGDRGDRTRRRGIITLFGPRNESQGSHDVQTVVLTVARYALELVIAKTQRDHLDAAFDLDVHRESSDRAFCSRLSEQAQVPNHDITQPSGHRLAPLASGHRASA